MSLDTIPGTEQQASVEGIPWGVDVSGYLVDFPAATVTAAEASLTNMTTGATVSLGSYVPSVSGNVITQYIAVGTLASPNVYRLLVLFTPSGTNAVLAASLEITCPF